MTRRRFLWLWLAVWCGTLLAGEAFFLIRHWVPARAAGVSALGAAVLSPLCLVQMTGEFLRGHLSPGMGLLTGFTWAGLLTHVVSTSSALQRPGKGMQLLSLLTTPVCFATEVAFLRLVCGPMVS